MPVEARREQQISLQLELQVVVNDQFQGLGTEPQCLEERQRTLIHGTISPTPHGLRQSLTMSLKLIQTPDPPASGSEVLRAEIIGVGLNRFSVKMQNNRRVRQSGEGRWACPGRVGHSFLHSPLSMHSKYSNNTCTPGIWSWPAEAVRTSSKRQRTQGFHITSGDSAYSGRQACAN